MLIVASFPWLYAAGIFTTAFNPLLPPPWLIVAVALGALPWVAVAGRRRHWAWLVLGICHGALWGHWQLSHTLPDHLDGEDFTVVGVVIDLPRVDARRSRFVLRVESVAGESPPPLRRVQLSWYGGQSPSLGERWQFQARLRRPRGFANPGGFDYRGWLLGEGISATGYVRAGATNQRLAVDAGGVVARLRLAIAGDLAERDDGPVAGGFLAALVLGDKSAIPQAAWDNLAATGTVHLMVVSGLHVGMVAGGCFLLGLGIGRLGSALGSTLPAPQLAAGLAVLGALGYALLAGAGLPLQRAVLMTLTATLALLVRRRAGIWQAFALALLGVAVIDPVAVLRAGFWLSFGAVAGLLLWFAPRPAAALAPVRHTYPRRLVEAQLVVFVALLGLLLFFQGSVSPVAPLVNLVAIPWVSLAIVPLCLLGVVARPWPALADGLWDLAAWQLHALAAFLDLAAGVGQALAWRPSGAGRLMVAAGFVLAAVLLALPGALAARAPALWLLIALLWSRAPPPPALELVVLDVGQGLASVVRAGDRTLVYDAGPAYSEAFDAGSGIVAPYLASRGVRDIDLMIISHGHDDHAGGAAPLARLVPPAETLAGVGPPPAVPGVQPCQSGQRWDWDDLELTMLWPPPAAPGLGANEGSCVLHLHWQGVHILLPGDIERFGEAALTASPRVAGDGQVQVLVAPHHGSRTSSSTAFVRWANPRHVVFSAGFRHHFGHPHPEVVARYKLHGTRLWHTAEGGAVSFHWSSPHDEPTIHQYRLRRWRPWWQR